MTVLRIKDKKDCEYIFDFDDFVRAVGEHMGDDAERYLTEYPVELAYEEYEKFKQADELQADGYLEQIREAYDAVGALYEAIRTSKFAKVNKYRGDLSTLLTKCCELKDMLNY